MTALASMALQAGKKPGNGPEVVALAVDLLGQQKYPPARTFAAAARRLLPA